MDHDLLLRELRAAFIGELDDQLRLYNRELLALEREGPATSPERVKTLFRIAHTLKGGARAVEAPALADLGHDLEEALDRLRAGGPPSGPEAFSALMAALFAAGDALAAAGAALRAHAAVDSRSLAPAREGLAGWIALYGAPSPPAPARPGPATVNDPAGAASAGGERRSAQDRARSAAADPASGGARVEAARLDALLDSSGELLIAVRHAEQRLEGLAALAGELLARPRSREPARAAGAASTAAENGRALAARVLEAARDQRELAGVAGQLDQQIRRVRLLPFAEALAGIERVARDAALGSDKEVEVAIQGGDGLFDRALIDGLRDPLRHLVRNAIDHGIEEAAERRTAGKPRRGQVTVAAQVRGGSIEVTVCDDGRGIDLERVRAEAARRGAVPPEDPRALARLVFEAGFSTAARVTAVSGRGVGLDIVRSRVQGMRGHVELLHGAGQGTTVRLTVPLTLTTIRAVLLRVGDQELAVPSHQVESLRRVQRDELPLVDGRRRLCAGGPPVLVVSLGALLGLGAPSPPAARKIALAQLAAGGADEAGDRAAFIVDELLDEAELTVKRLPRRLAGAPHLSGAAILPSGRVALILNVQALIDSALAQTGDDVALRATQPARARKRVLLVDDSITTRGLERSILEAAGYEVMTAADGAEAWRLLQEKGADILVSDIEMPNVDGFQLTERVRGASRFARLPIVLVTGLASESDRARGLDLGADAYLVKSAFQQSSLLETVADLVRG